MTGIEEKGLIPLVYRRILALILTVAVLSAGVVAFASERDETISSEYVAITGSECVVDSLYGVDAIYSTWSSTYHCFEYVTRFYETVYGITVEYSNTSLPGTDSSSCWFEVATTPKAGDIAFASASRRGGSDHWAIVKSYDAEAGTITLIEQNYKWNGCAEVNRTITYPSSYYEIYTLVSADGAVEPVIDITQYETDSVSGDLPEEEEAEAEETAEDFAISGAYSDYVLPYALQAASIGMQIRTEGYTEAIDLETFCDLILSLLDASDYDYTAGEPAPDAGSLQRALAMGIIDESFLTENAAFTREDAAVIMQNLVSWLGMDVIYDLSEVAEFADYTTISADAVDAAALMLEMGIMDGSTLYGVYAFQPTAEVTYEQALTMLMRLYNYVPDVVTSTVVVEAAASVPVSSASSETLPTE